MTTTFQNSGSHSSGERSPEQVRIEVERTQADLQRDVDQLSEKVNPKNVISRKTEGLRSSAGGVRNKVMGIPGAVGETSSNVTGDIARTAKGNPLAAGVVALGIGWIVGGLIPVTQREKQKAAELEQHAQDEVMPAIDEAKRVISQG